MKFLVSFGRFSIIIGQFKPKKMKNVSIFLILMSTSFVMSAQIGIRGGLNYSNVSVDNGGPDFGENNKPGYQIGLQGNIPLAGIISLRPAMLYNNKGGNQDQSNGGSTSLKYFEIPANLGLNIGGDGFKVVIEAGPYFGYLVDASSDFVANIGSRINKSDWGANFGVVAEISNLGVGVNYSNSLAGIDSDDQLNQAFRLKNGNLALFIYVKLF